PSAPDRALVGHAPQPIAIRRRHQLGATDQIPADLLGLPIVRHLVDGREHVSAHLVQHRRDGAATRLLVHGPIPCRPACPPTAGVYIMTYDGEAPRTVSAIGAASGEWMKAQPFDFH